MKKISPLILAIVLLLACPVAFGQHIMKAMDGTTKLNGGSALAGHADEIELLSNSQGTVRCATCNTSNVFEYNIMIRVSAATVSFKKLLLTGKKLTTIDVVYLKQGGAPFTYYKLRMENVTVTSVQESATSPDVPVFAVALRPDRIAWQYLAQNQDGSVGAKTSYGWDVTNNVAWSFSF